MGIISPIQLLTATLPCVTDIKRHILAVCGLCGPVWGQCVACVGQCGACVASVWPVWAGVGPV